MKIEIAQSRLRQYVEYAVPYVDTPFILAKMGEGPAKLAINVGTHGNEVVPLVAVRRGVKKLRQEGFLEPILFTVANPMALYEYKRYRNLNISRK